MPKKKHTKTTNDGSTRSKKAGKTIRDGSESESEDNTNMAAGKWTPEENDILIAAIKRVGGTGGDWKTTPQEIHKVYLPQWQPSSIKNKLRSDSFWRLFRAANAPPDSALGGLFLDKMSVIDMSLYR